MARRVDQVEDIVLAVACLVFEPNGLGLDGDARSRSISMESSTCSFISRSSSAPVSWISRSASVDLPWSMCATMEKLRIFWIGDAVMARQITPGVPSFKRSDLPDSLTGNPV